MNWRIGVTISRGYTTLSAAKPVNHTTAKGLMINSIYKFSKTLKSDKNFSFQLINKHFNQEFFDRYDKFFHRTLSDLRKELCPPVQKAETITQGFIGRIELLNGFQTPNSKITPLLVQKLLDSKDNLRSLPISINPVNLDKEDTIAQVQAITDEIIEKLVYYRMKPHSLQFTYNDASNIQNFNKNLTFNVMDIDNPYEWFPEARKLKRKFIMHVGPTNSGKTYNALKRLENSSIGYFAGPLRLLAREVYDKFQDKGIRCNLVTGEEVIIDVDEFGNKAGITSGTIEMISLTESYDVVVVDEIQMIGDEFRGSAWTNAVLGVRAKEIHLCGEIAAIPLIQKLVSMTGDELEINEYNRLGKLVVDEEPVSMEDLQVGDAVVCFSKNAILNMKLQIEQHTNFKCAVIYGALPPETRAQEAQRFNNGQYDIVIASDAIGMGLNLKINRVVFTTTEKYNGRTMVRLTPSNIKQIGGRAGRFGVGESIGHITAINHSELAVVKEGIEAPVQYLEKAFLFPLQQLWAKYYSMFAKNTDTITMYRKFEVDLSKLLRETKSMKRDFDIQSLRDYKLVSNFIYGQRFKKSFLIYDQITCVACPTTISDKFKQPLKLVTDDLMSQFFSTIAKREKKSIFDFASMPFYLTTTSKVLQKKPLRNEIVGTYYTSKIDQVPVPAREKEQLLSKIATAESKTYKSKDRNVRFMDPVQERLKDLEMFHKAMGTYIWLSYRFPQNFVDSESAVKMKELIEVKISEMLTSLRSAEGGDSGNGSRFPTFERKKRY